VTHGRFRRQDLPADSRRVTVHSPKRLFPSHAPCSTPLGAQVARSSRAGEHSEHPPFAPACPPWHLSWNGMAQRCYSGGRCGGAARGSQEDRDSLTSSPPSPVELAGSFRGVVKEPRR
jgi:hypothetical protein